MVSSPVVSPSGDKVAFAVTRGEEGALDFQAGVEAFSKTTDTRMWVVSLKNGEATDTRAEICTASTPLTWAHDESHIVFVSGRLDPLHNPSFQSLESIDLQSHELALIESERAWGPKYSANGTHLGYIRDTDLIVENVQAKERKLLAKRVNRYNWCWGVGNSRVFYIRDGFLVCEFSLQSQTERILHSASPEQGVFPLHVVCSPDGSLLGYCIDDWFTTIDLRTGETRKRFKCGHYFLAFDWNASGICYVDALDGDQRTNARLMVFNPSRETSTPIAEGVFAFPSWASDSQIIVRKGNAELWLYSVADGTGSKLFGP
ncbi:TolB-like translocation protein [Roseiconus lacunae]|uniref:hypothetical protein n=1 Tax=Roseiconus lacunae TaxID=2605694 RepID=UPI001E658C6E|nr:hypothetical protein [Roseiconus lacunae]